MAGATAGLIERDLLGLSKDAETHRDKVAKANKQESRMYYNNLMMGINNLDRILHMGVLNLAFLQRASPLDPMLLDRCKCITDVVVQARADAFAQVFRLECGLANPGELNLIDGGGSHHHMHVCSTHGGEFRDYIEDRFLSRPAGRLMIRCCRRHQFILENMPQVWVRCRVATEVTRVGQAHTEYVSIVENGYRV